MLLAASEYDIAIGGVIALIGALVGFLSQRVSDRNSFDQRLRLEKEYQLYAQMWEKLFAFRCDVGTRLDPGTHPQEMPTVEEIRVSFNAYQSVVRRGEPFFSNSIYGPARAITAAGHELIANLQRIEHPLNLGPDPRGKIRQLELENEQIFRTIDANFITISSAVRKRVGPP